MSSTTGPGTPHPQQGPPATGHPPQGDPAQGHAAQPGPAQGYPSQGHSAQGYPTQGYPVAPPTHPQALMVLILGIISVTMFPPCGPFAWRMGSKALKEIDASGLVYRDRGQVVAGQVTGIIGTILLVLIVLLVIAQVIALIGTLAVFGSLPPR